MKQDWTPEPWELRTDGWTIRGTHGEQKRISHTYTPTNDAAIVVEQVANAARIVECVNACSGMLEPAAEILQLRELLTAAVLRVELANKEGDPILSAWLPDARAALSAARTEPTP